MRPVLPLLLLAACHHVVPGHVLPSPSTEASSVRSDPEALGCPERFPAAVRSTWHEIGGERYRIDAQGRPEQAVALLPGAGPEKRIESCQLVVGHWGDDLPGPENYDGGHMIGSQLGGWGARANMVPQVANFNRGNWLQVENALASCSGELAAGRVRYLVTVTYPDALAVVPSTMQMDLTDTATGQAISLVFDNAMQGGEHGRETRDRGVQWLRTLGCE